MFHPRILGLDGRLKSKKEIEGLNKVLKKIIRQDKALKKKDSTKKHFAFQEMQAKKEAEMVQKIIEKVKMKNDDDS